MRQGIWSLVILMALLSIGYVRAAQPQAAGRFKDDTAFLAKQKDVIVLTDAGGRQQVAVSPMLQGRVMTSSAEGPDGLSFGWINREALASGVNNPHMNSFGGEDRFWLGPEGGQFSLFFKKGEPFDLDHWFTPPAVNEESFKIVGRSADRIEFAKDIKLVNYSGTRIDVAVKRVVRLLGADEVRAMGIPVTRELAMVAFASENTIRNIGAAAWTKDTGLVSIWILGMFNPSDTTTIVIPFAAGPASTKGAPVNDAYFGKVPADRLRVEDKGVLFFKADGKYRSKIGLSPLRVKPFAGSWDARNGVLTIVHLTMPPAPNGYVNSMWEIQKKPFAGDVINSYNDGPTTPGGKPLGPFYELESSSPAAALAPNAIMTHVHATVHLRGDRKALDGIARTVLGVGLDEIEKALAK